MSTRFFQIVIHVKLHQTYEKNVSVNSCSNVVNIDYESIKKKHFKNKQTTKNVYKFIYFPHDLNDHWV